MKSLSTAIEVLKTFIDTQGDLSVSEVVERVGLKTSHVSKILSSLRDSGMLDQDPRTRRYSVGVEAFELGTRYIVRSQPAREALPIMRQLADVIGHSATLSILRERHVLHIMAVEGSHYIDGRWRVGNRMPVHATASGQVLLAWMPHQRREALLQVLELKPFTEHTITRLEDLRVVTDRVLKAGCAITRGESAPGLTAMAVPVFDERNEVKMTMGLVLPDHLFDAADCWRLQEALFDAARSLSLKIGASAYPFGGGPTGVVDMKRASRGA